MHSILCLSHEELLTAHDAHALVWPLEADLLVRKDRVIQDLFDRMAADTVQYCGEEPVEVVISDYLESGKRSVVNWGYSASFFAGLPSG